MATSLLISFESLWHTRHWLLVLWPVSLSVDSHQDHALDVLVQPIDLSLQNEETKCWYDPGHAMSVVQSIALA